LVTPLIVAGTIALATAASDLEREYEKLTLDREKAFTAAAEPIDRRYKAGLEALLRRAAQSNDQEAVLRIKQALAALAAKAANTEEVAQRAQSEFVGIWTFQNLSDGQRGTFELQSNGSFYAKGKQLGEWNTKGKQLVLVHANRGGHTDRFDLPVRLGKLEGKNTMGHNVILERKVE
jgi:hypothetical protein